jgi:hypothetical protein
MSNSGKVSFVCLSPSDPSERPLSECTAQQFTSICQYEYEDDAGNIDAGVQYDDAGNPLATLFPHLYALVTQDTTGEVAVVDTSAIAGGVLNLDPLEPGANFLQIGAQPTGIVSTPGGVATFVGTAELGRQALYAIPSSQIRPTASYGVPDTCIGPADASAEVPPSFTSWPACFLDTTPGDILLLSDPGIVQKGLELQRRKCAATADGSADPGDYVQVVPQSDSISSKENSQGRYKLVVALPDLGGIAVFDAQDVLNRAPGSFDACTPEIFLPLKVDLTGLAAQPPPLPTTACGNAALPTPPLQPSYTPRPGGMSYADGKLYIADLNAPVIHVIDMHQQVPGLGDVQTPCHPREQAPLLPTSVAEPARVVFTSKVTAAPNLTPQDFKRYLYATDVKGATGTENGSAMVFDISPTSTTRRPLVRQHPEWNPFQPRDRVVFAAPAADIVLAQRDAPAIDPVTGVAPSGVLCNPEPSAVTCIAGGHNCDLGTSYRTSSDYTMGAGPQKLRGEFAFAALTNGKVAVIDVTDFDAPCRTPVDRSGLAGCSGNEQNLITSSEVSCNIVPQTGQSPAFNQPRSANYLAVGTLAGNRVPGIQTYPLLYAADGSVLADTMTTTAPRMVATMPWAPAPGGKRAVQIPAACTQSCNPNGCGTMCDQLPGCPLQLFVSGQQTPIDVEANVCSTACEPHGAPCQQSTDCCSDVGGSTCDSSVGICRPVTCKNDQSGCTPSSSTDPLCNAAFCTNPANGMTWTKSSKPQAFTPGGIGNNHALVLNMEDPRVHVADQNWTVTFEGAIPGFDQRFVQLQRDTPAQGEETLSDPTSSINFCDKGVLSQRAFEDLLLDQGASTTAAAVDLADYVQITSDLPAATDPYWTGMDGGAGSCNYFSCLDQFGPIDAPELYTTRDLRILEAYQDHVTLEPRCPRGQAGCLDIGQLLCCFPTALNFTVRVGNQWAVAADQIGFIHHVVADATTGKCRNACDPTLVRKNARLTETPPTDPPLPVPDRAPTDHDPWPSFQNPMFRFAIVSGSTPTRRDTVFKFATNNSFAPLLIGLATDGTSLILPRSISYLPSTMELAVTDGSNNGLIMVSLATAQVSRAFF